MADPTDGYDITHRAFLQAFLARQTLTLNTARPILAAILSASEDSRPILPADISQADFDSYIHTINAAISPFDYEIRSCIPQAYKSPDAANQARRERVYALVNTTSDTPTQLATTHKPEEIAYVKRLLDEMFDHYNTPTREIMAVTSIEALNVARAKNSGQSIASNADGDAQVSGTGLTKTQAEAVLKSLVEEGWFVKMGGYYTLSVRALMELRDWLRETYNEEAGEDAESDDEGVVRVKSCQACREIVTIGQRCGRRECKARLHEHCMDQCFRVQRSETCPLCKSEWTGRDFVGPKAARARERDSGARREADRHMSE